MAAIEVADASGSEGRVTPLAMVLTLEPAKPFPAGKQLGSYFGPIPNEYSIGGRQRGHISKQGSSWLRFLLVEAAQSAVRYKPDSRRRLSLRGYLLVNGRLVF